MLWAPICWSVEIYSLIYSLEDVGPTFLYLLRQRPVSADQELPLVPNGLKGLSRGALAWVLGWEWGPEEVQRHEKGTGPEQELRYHSGNDSYSHTSFLKQECYSFQQNSHMTLKVLKSYFWLGFLDKHMRQLHNAASFWQDVSDT